MRLPPARRAFGLALVCSAAFAISLAAAADEPPKPFELKPETRNYDIRHLKLDLRFDLKAAKVEGTCSLTLAPKADGFAVLYLHSKDITVTAVRIEPEGQPPRPAARFRTGDGLLRVDLDQPYPKDAPLQVHIDYEAAPSKGLYFFAPTQEHPEIPWQVWSQGEGTDNRYWYPCYDEPDDRFTSEIVARVPAGFTFLSNGKCVLAPAAGAPAPSASGPPGKGSVVDLPKEETVWHYRFDHEHVNYLVSAIVGRFDRVEEAWDGIPLIAFVPPGRAPEARLAFGLTGDMMKCFSEFTGERYPYGSYTQTTVWDFMWGGMENTTVTTLNLRALHDHRSHLDYQADGLVAHELAHMWFGDLLTCEDWSEMWLNEGFASYFTDLWVLSHHGPDRFAVGMHGTFSSVAGQSTPESRKDLKPEKEGKKPLELPKGMNYNKGSAVLHMLRGVMGEEKFRDGIRRYVAKHRHSCVTSEELRASMEEAHGGDLAWFFDEWVYGAGYPSYQVSFDWSEERREGVVRVRQTQAESAWCGLFKMPVDLVFWTGAGSDFKAARRERVWVSEREQSFVFPCEQRPAWLRFDEGEKIVKRLEFPRSVDELALQLQFDEVTGRIEAAEELGKLGPAAVPALRDARRKETVAGVREVIVGALARIKADESCLAVLAALDDVDSEVRTAAADALGDFAADKVAERLKQALALDESYWVRGAAARSLGKCKAPGAFEVLELALAQPSYREIIREGAVAGMLALDDPRAVGKILPLMDYRFEAGGQHHLARAAIDGLARSGTRDQRVAARLEALLADPYFRTRAAAARGLAQLHATASLPALVDRWKTERNEEAKGAIEGAIKDLGKAEPAPDADVDGKTAEELLARADRLEADAKDLSLDAELRRLEAAKLRVRAARLGPAAPGKKREGEGK